MGTLEFKYGTMGCGKTEALIQKYNRLIRYSDATVIVMKVDPTVKASDVNDMSIKSRSGNSINADYLIHENCNFKMVLLEILSGSSNVNVTILIDEAQFLTTSNVRNLHSISRHYYVDIICFGLKLNFKGEMFAASRELLKLSTDRICLDAVNSHKCKRCQNIASHNLKICGSNDEVEIGGDDMYESVCKSCWEKYNGGDAPKVKRNGEDDDEDLGDKGIREYSSRDCAVEHPSYYKTKNGIEVLDLIRHMPWAKGNAIKYIFRAGNKDKSKEVEDLRKAIFCLEDLIKDITSRGE